jgi:Fe-Mn family superoxide dismutase
MTPNGGGLPTEIYWLQLRLLLELLKNLKASFSKAGATQFGSGWAWLCVQRQGRVEVCGTPNQTIH